MVRGWGQRLVRRGREPEDGHVHGEAEPHDRTPTHDPGHPHRHPHGVADAAGGENELPNIGVVGAGRVGRVLATAFSRAGWPVTAVASRDARRRAAVQSLVPGVHAFQEAASVLDDADLVFLTVPDDVVVEVATGLRLYSGQALVHTSGLLPASVLAPAMAAGTMAGSFHPLVAFADPDRALAALTGATVAVEGDDPLVVLLGELAEAIGARAVRVLPGGKAAYHAAAMLAAGGFVALLDAITQLGGGAGLDERGSLAVYGPLVRQALADAEALGVSAALTGPVVRGDRGTVEAHVEAISRLAPEALELYTAAARREISLAVTRGDLQQGRADELRESLKERPRGTLQSDPGALPSPHAERLAGDPRRASPDQIRPHDAASS